MTTNRMGLEQTLSDGELTVITGTDHVQCGDAAAMARELLAYRKAGSEPVAYIDDLELNRIKGVDSGVIRTPIYGPGYQDAHIPLYAAPPLAVTVPDEVTFEQAMLEVHGRLSPAEAFQKAWNHLRGEMLKSVTNEP